MLYEEPKYFVFHQLVVRPKSSTFEGVLCFRDHPVSHLVMRLFTSFFVLALTLAGLAHCVTKGISTDLLNRFIKMANICMSAYVDDLCLYPGGLPILADITNDATDVHGWVLRDDTTREIIAVFRGTESITNLLSDTNYTLANFDTFPECGSCQVHGGYYLLWVSVHDQVLTELQSAAASYPDYGIVLTGHR